jgi:hypothetical protein
MAEMSQLPPTDVDPLSPFSPKIDAHRVLPVRLSVYHQRNPLADCVEVVINPSRCTLESSDRLA